MEQQEAGSSGCGQAVQEIDLPLSESEQEIDQILLELNQKLEQEEQVGIDRIINS